MAFLSAHALGCAPSDFDALTDQTRDPAECSDSDCEDGAADELDASQEDELDADAASEEMDGEVQDAPDAHGGGDAMMAPADAGSSESNDASGDDAASHVPDSGARPCNGNPSVCKANEVERQMEACGNCNRGTRTRTRTCAADGCSWGAFGAWSACSNATTECDPGAPAQTQTVACTTCGSRTQTRTCSRDTCTWGAWSDSSACSWCEECSEVVYCDTPADIADRGTWCRQKACSREQALADCLEDIVPACGTTIQPFFMQYL
jgi:hypothetical protein